MDGSLVTTVFGILVSSVGAVLFLRAVLLREYSIRLLWPSLLLAWLLVGSSLLFTVGTRLLPQEAALVTFVERYPDLLLVLMLLAAAIGGWLCRPFGHKFAQRLPQG